MKKAPSPIPGRALNRFHAMAEAFQRDRLDGTISLKLNITSGRIRGWNFLLGENWSDNGHAVVDASS